MIRYVGLDVHRKSVQVCITDAGGTVLDERVVDCTAHALAAFAQETLTREDQVALEATFHSWAIVDAIEPWVAQVVVSNPLQTKAIAQAKVKTDKIDARVLAHLLRCDYLPLVWRPDAKTRLLRTLTGRRAGLISERTRLKNRVHSVLAHELIPVPEGDLFSSQGQQWLKEQPLSEVARALIESDQRLLEAVAAELEVLHGALAQHAWQDERTRLLMTIPGVDFTVAQGLLAALGDADRFEHGNNAAAYLGLVPCTHQTGGPGSRTYHGPITKHGNPRARWLLIQAAQQFARHPGPLGVFFRRLLKKKNRNVAVVATARKLAVIAVQMLKHNEPYRYAQPVPTQAKLARLRVQVTGKKRAAKRAGVPRPATYGSGVWSWTRPGLPQVCAQEGLPPVTPYEQLPAGELRMLARSRVAGYVESIQEPKRLTRAAPKKAAAKATNAGRGTEEIPGGE